MGRVGGGGFVSEYKVYKRKRQESWVLAEPTDGFLLKAGQDDWALPRGGAWRVKPSLIC